MRAFVLVFLLAACQADETLTAYGGQGSWALTAINDVPFKAKAHMTLETGGAVRGEAPCNQFSTTQTAPYPWFTLAPIMSTKRACEHLGEEAQFFEMLSKMTLSEISGPVLILSNDTGETMEFSVKSGD